MMIVTEFFEFEFESKQKNVGGANLGKPLCRRLEIFETTRLFRHCKSRIMFASLLVTFTVFALLFREIDAGKTAVRILGTGSTGTTKVDGTAATSAQVITIYGIWRYRWDPLYCG